MVTARSGDEISKVSLESRFQEAIDEAAMRAGAVDADAYLSGWVKDPWLEYPGSPLEVAEAIALELTKQFTDERISAILDRF